jgi:AmmeMemoRadiSam system protein B
MDEGLWRTPLGNVEIDAETAKRIVQETRLVDVDDLAHRFEHSIEVQLPFLQYLYGSDFKFVPICFQIQDLSSAMEVGKALIEVLANKNAVIIASSDMTHYEPQENTSKKDREALKAVVDMDEKRFYSIIEMQNVTACGYGPIAAAIVAAKGLGAKEAKLLCYKNSGDITGDYSRVVGYAALSFKKNS